MRCHQMGAVCRQPLVAGLVCSAAPAVGLTAAFYCFVGLFGYLNFPTDAHSNILLNYPGVAMPQPKACPTACLPWHPPLLPVTPVATAASRQMPCPSTLASAWRALSLSHKLLPLVAADTLQATTG